MLLLGGKNGSIMKVDQVLIESQPAFVPCTININFIVGSSRFSRPDWRVQGSRSTMGILDIDHFSGGTTRSG